MKIELRNQLITESQNEKDEFFRVINSLTFTKQNKVELEELMHLLKLTFFDWTFTNEYFFLFPIDTRQVLFTISLEEK